MPKNGTNGKWQLMSYILSGIIVLGLLTLTKYVVANDNKNTSGHINIRQEINEEIKDFRKEVKADMKDLKSEILLAIREIDGR